MSKVLEKVSLLNSWVFRCADGNIVVAQFPNRTLTLWIALRVLSELVSKPYSTAISGGASAVLIYWSYLEITQGDNNFRKILGVAVLIFTLSALIKTIS
jgi:hypothetical protein